MKIGLSGKSEFQIMKSDNYFTFPLSILRGEGENSTPLDSLYLAIDCGCMNAGKGFLKRNGLDKLEELFLGACDHFGFDCDSFSPPDSIEGLYIVGAKLCGLSLPQEYDVTFSASKADSFLCGEEIPFIRMASESLWASLNQERFELDPTNKKPNHGLSWREFRVLAAILSWHETKEGFTSIGWESIQFRANGFVKKWDFKIARRFPDHLPKLSRKQIRATLDTLEALGMFARFRLSTGQRGGRMYYSFRHSREELAEAVCLKVNFRDRARITQNRQEDFRKCLESLERAKSGTSPEQVRDNQGAK